jgi:hypothetical protein
MGACWGVAGRWAARRGSGKGWSMPHASSALEACGCVSGKLQIQIHCIFKQ